MSWQVPHAAADSAWYPSRDAEEAGGCGAPGAGSEIGPTMRPSVASVSGLLCVPSTDLAEWQKKQVTPCCEAGSVARLRPSVVVPSCTATGAWHFTQKLPSAPLVSRWPRWFIAMKTGSSDAYACMLRDQSATWVGWQFAHTLGSRS